MFQYAFAVVVPEDSDEHNMVKTLFDKYTDDEDKKVIHRILRVQSYFCLMRFNL